MSTTENTQREQGEERQQLLIRESVALDEHREAPSAAALVDGRKILIAHVKEIAASGNAEAIVEMEKDFIQNDLDRYAKADDKEMIGSLNAALLGVAAIKQQLGLLTIRINTRPLTRDTACPKTANRVCPWTKPASHLQVTVRAWLIMSSTAWKRPKSSLSTSAERRWA